MVSIIMPCYNAGKYIREAIESVLNQTYSDWELIIVDDGSTDNSMDIAERLAISDSRIRLIMQPNAGACRARNNGIEHANGEYVKFLDADDILEPECLLTQVNQIASLHPRQIPFGDYYNVDKDGNVLNQYTFDRADDLAKDAVFFFFSEWRILISSPLHRTALLREIGGFNESLKRGQESDMHMRLALSDVEFVYQPCMTFRYRDHNVGTRISIKYQEGTKGRHDFWIQRAHICEQLLLEKYGIVPIKYYCYFSREWFGYARELFAQGKQKEGNEYLNKAKIYGWHNSFQRIYSSIGAIIGYVLLEKLCQLRLKILGKK